MFTLIHVLHQLLTILLHSQFGWNRARFRVDCISADRDESRPGLLHEPPDEQQVRGARGGSGGWKGRGVRVRAARRQRLCRQRGLEGVPQRKTHRDSSRILQRLALSSRSQSWHRRVEERIPRGKEILEEWSLKTNY
jgi:hypothetical protein